MDLKVLLAQASHTHFAETICQMMEEAAEKRGTGIAKREPSYLVTKMMEGKAIIALHGDTVAGFCYIETWQHGKYVANSGLIVGPDFQGLGLARKIKEAVLQLSRDKYPEARIFGITTSAAVLKINSDLGYRPVTFADLPQDETFWKGCQSCPNHDILIRHHHRMCLCTGMLAPSKVELMKFDLSNQILQNHE